MNFPSRAEQAAKPIPSPVVDLAARRRVAVTQARAVYATAPAHIKLMAGPYIGPILEALQALGAELDGRA